jgi:hypothetical protein
VSRRKQDAAALLKQMLEQLNSQPEAANDEEPMTDEEIEELAAKQAEDMIRARRR